MRFVAARILMPGKRTARAVLKAVGTEQARFGFVDPTASEDAIHQEPWFDIFSSPPLPPLSRAAAPPHPPPRPRGPHPFSPPVLSPQYAQGRQKPFLGNGLVYNTGTV